VNELVKPGVTVAYVNWGRWVAQCSWQIRCDAALELTGAENGFRCPECGGDNAIVWPSAEMVAGIGRILLMRPHRKNQNWLPGETLQDLMQENAEHGILTMHAAALEPGPVYGIQDDRLIFDALPTLNPRRELVP
jgi:hypothetical protein